jgi:ribosomal-protein-serine acetyltransferase
MASTPIALIDFHVTVDDDTEVRPIHSADAEELYLLVRENEEHLYPWMGWVPAQGYTREDMRDFIRRSEKAAREQLQFNAAIVQRGKIIGGTGFPVIDWTNRIAQIGYWLDRSHTGHGLMTQSVRALLTYAFDALEMNRIEIRCATNNKASAAVAERLGFTREGILRQGLLIRDTYVDEYLFSMLRDEWESADRTP